MSNLKVSGFLMSILVLLACSNSSVTPPAPAGANPNLIELLGQSNAEGAAYPLSSVLPSDITLPIAGAQIYSTTTQAWVPLDAPHNSGIPYFYADGHDNTLYIPGNAFGVEFRLMKLLQAHYGTTQYMIKYAMGATSLVAQGAPDTYDGLDWSVGSEGELFDQSNTNHNNALVALGDNRPPKAVIWIQGEGDTGGTAGQYQSNLEAFISAKRTAYNAPNLPFIIVRLGNLQTLIAGGSGFNTVRAAQEAVAAQPNNYLVDADGLPCNTTDNIHYTAASYDTLAQRIFDVLITL